MGQSTSEFPVHEELTVVEGDTVYRTDDWWKGVVRYRFRDAETTEVAIYLWHCDDGVWKRKNKYTVKTADAWAEDRRLVESLLADTEPAQDREEDPSTVPVSDYYTVDSAYTVFRTEEWWKAVVRISEKGDYETTEVIVYVWQHTDDGWRRRQKYATKDLDDWDEERDLVESLLSDGDDTSRPGRMSEATASGTDDGSGKTIGGELDELNEELKRTHLSSELAG